MVGLKFINNYEGRRIEKEFSMKPYFVEPEGDEDGEPTEEFEINLSLEQETGKWKVINPQLPDKWRAQDWKSRPVRFVDGKDVGQTVAWLRGTDGSFVAIRLVNLHTFF